MTESNSPFSTTAELVLPVPLQKVWNGFIAPDQVRWNYAVRRLETSLGFHTGSLLDIEWQTLKGSWTIRAEVLDSVPLERLTFLSQFRYCFLFKHHEVWCFSCYPLSDYSTLIKASYSLGGPFAAKLWTEDKKLLVTNLLELWLESLKFYSLSISI